MPFNDVDFRQRVALCNARSQVAYARHEATRTPQSGGSLIAFKDVVPPLSDKDDRASAVVDEACSSALTGVAGMGVATRGSAREGRGRDRCGRDRRGQNGRRA